MQSFKRGQHEGCIGKGGVVSEYDPQDDAMRSYYAAIEAKRLRGDHLPKLYCGECDSYETNTIFLDVERCSKCGELIEESDDEA